MNPLMPYCAAILLSVSVAAQDPGYDPKTPASVIAYRDGLMKKYAHDPTKLAEELQKLARDLAYATNRGAEHDQTDALIQKYGGIPSHMTRLLPAQNTPGKIIDHSAWTILLERNGREVTVTAFLDKPRYNNAVPKTPLFRLRSMGATPQEERRLELGELLPDTLRADLAYTLEPDGVYKLKLALPASGKYCLNVSAELEPGWATDTTVPL